MTNDPKHARNYRIYDLRMSGMKGHEIAQQEGITAERVYVITRRCARRIRFIRNGTRDYNLFSVEEMIEILRRV